jgi:hypothetical protein
LERLGHQAIVYADRTGEAARLAGERGVRVETSLDAIDGCDAGLAQDSAAAYELAEQLPGAPLVFVAHSEVMLQTPPQLAGACAAAVALNDRIAAHLRTLALAPEVVRLRQPVNTSRFGALGLARRRVLSVAVFGNNVPPSRVLLIRGACERCGHRVELIGRRGATGGSPHPERELGRADVVIGIGRCAIEGMASGRAVYVYGLAGGDGWVTAESYPALEADGFSGRATSAVIDATPAMGRINRDLVNANHDYMDHARALVELWRRVGAAAPPPVPAAELARLNRVQRATEETAATFAMESQMWQLAAEDARAQLKDARAELAKLKRSLRFRVGAAFAWPIDALRRRRARRNGSGR